MYASIVLIELMLLVTAIVNVGTNRLVGRKLKWEAIAAFSLVAAAALAEAIAAFVPVAIAALAETGNILSQSVPLFLYGLHQFARLLEFCCAPLIGVAVAIAFGWTRKPLIPLAISGLHVVFQLVCFPLKLVFSVDRQNVFHRELLYPVYVAIFLLSMAYCFLAIIRSNRRYHSGNDSVLMMTLATILTGILIETCSYGRIRVSYLAIAVSCQLLASRSYQLSMQMDGVTELLNRQCYKNCLSNLHSDCVIIFFDINDANLMCLIENRPCHAGNSYKQKQQTDFCDEQNDFFLLFLCRLLWCQILLRTPSRWSARCTGTVRTRSAVCPRLSIWCSLWSWAACRLPLHRTSYLSIWCSLWSWAACRLSLHRTSYLSVWCSLWSWAACLLPLHRTSWLSAFTVWYSSYISILIITIIFLHFNNRTFLYFPF